ncbi:MAG: zf-HC2 domain-containing protein [bacterium]|nr:zf-HC2 domain-containing protein [bacterium]
MKCRKVKRLLSIYIDGELEGSKSQEVENHLSTCVSCAGELESLSKQSSHLRELFASIRVPALSPDFAREFYEQLEEKGRWWEIDWWFPYQQPVLAGVAMACLLLAILFYPKGNGVKVGKDEPLPLIVREAVSEVGRLSEQEILKNQAEDIISRLL